MTDLVFVVSKDDEAQRTVSHGDPVKAAVVMAFPADEFEAIRRAFCQAER